MGWLTDIGNAAVGAIERDREITKEDLILRAENLKANQQIYVEQKKKKYNKELESYYKEKEKFDNIEKMNAWAKDGTVNKDAYAAFALSSTIPDWKSIPNDTKSDMIANYDGTTIDYKISGSAAEINAKAAKAMSLINDQTAEEIKNAKGNSFLINKILRKKETAEKDIYAAIENQLKAIDTVKMTEKSTTNAGLEIKQTGDKTAINWKRFQKKNPKYVDRFNDLDDKIIWKSASQNNNFLNFMTQNDLLGTSNKFNFELKNNSKEISGLNDSARAILKSYEMVYNQITKSMSAQTLAAQGVDITELKNYVSLAEVNKRVQNIIEERHFRLDIGDGFGGGRKIDFIGILPVDIVDINGYFTLDSGAEKRLRIDGVKDVYKNFLEVESQKLLDKPTADKDFDEATNDKARALSIIQASVESGGKYANLFKLDLQNNIGRDDPDTEEIESITQHPKVLADEKMANEDVWAKKPPRIRDPIHKIVETPDGDLVFRPSTEGVNKGIRIMQNGTGFQQKQPNGNWKPILWEEVKKNNEVNKLPPYLKLKYDLWEAGKLKQAGKSTQVKETEKEYLPNKIFTVD
jgi:hypothetical protein